MPDSRHGKNLTPQRLWPSGGWNTMFAVGMTFPGFILCVLMPKLDNTVLQRPTSLDIVKKFRKDLFKG